MLNVKFIHDNKIPHLCLHTLITKLIARAVLQKIIKLINCLRRPGDACASYYHHSVCSKYRFRQPTHAAMVFLRGAGVSRAPAHRATLTHPGQGMAKTQCMSLINYLRKPRAKHSKSVATLSTAQDYSAGEKALYFTASSLLLAPSVFWCPEHS